MSEYFSDMVATYAVGPMFGWAASVLYFDPISSFDTEDLLDTHPATAKMIK